MIPEQLKHKEEEYDIDTYNEPIELKGIKWVKKYLLYMLHI